MSNRPDADGLFHISTEIAKGILILSTNSSGLRAKVPSNTYSIPNRFRKLAMQTDRNTFQIDVEGLILERNLPVGTYRLNRVIHGLENSPAVRRMLSTVNERERILNNTMVTLVAGQGYMRVDRDDTILVAQEHLRSSDERVVYLDFIHELVHLKQAEKGRTLYDTSVRYVDKDTEIEAYQVVVTEGRRIGMNDKELGDYLMVPWITAEELKRFLKKLGVKHE